MLNVIIVVLTFLVSMMVSIMIMRNRGSRWSGMLAAIAINVLVLVIAYVQLYNHDEKSRRFGIDYEKRYTLLLSIPILTYMNFSWLSISSRRKMINQKNREA
ncbi:DUF4231 domain-containing protein [Paenibacillus rhizovicinus]|uniref:DUF4231 domain-containing protein n=1 Tax=Paenibacillus rhizovicinus TaxID=2704463 RepID=UPI00384D857E